MTKGDERRGVALEMAVADRDDGGERTVPTTASCAGNTSTSNSLFR